MADLPVFLVDVHRVQRDGHLRASRQDKSAWEDKFLVSQPCWLERGVVQPLRLLNELTAPDYQRPHCSRLREKNAPNQGTPS